MIHDHVIKVGDRTVTFKGDGRGPRQPDKAKTEFAQPRSKKKKDDGGAVAKVVAPPTPKPGPSKTSGARTEG